MMFSVPLNSGLTCNYQTISNIISYFGIYIPEEFVFLIMRYNYKKDCSIHIPYYSNNALSKLGFYLDIRTFCGKRDFENNIRDILAKKYPIILNVKSSLLPYYPDRPDSNQNEAHVLILHGIKDELVLISDSYIPFYPPECLCEWINIEILFQATIASKDNDKLIILVKKEDIPVDLKKIVADNLKTLLYEEIENNKKMLLVEQINNKAFEDMGGNKEVFNLLSRKEIEKIVKLYRIKWLSFDGPAQIRLFLVNIFLNLQEHNLVYQLYVKKFEKYYREWINISNAYLRFSIIYDMDYFNKISKRYVSLLNEEINFMKEVILEI